MIPFFRRHVAPDELACLREALASAPLAGDGPWTRDAEARLSGLVGGLPVRLVTSCTGALELAGLALELGPEDEVVVPAWTFPSTANAFALRGARVRLADVDLDTWSMELPQLEAAATPRTTVVVTVAYGGVARDTGAIRRWCDAHGARLIEDAAQALFATDHGRPLGTFGSLAALSFQASKNVSSGAGGAIVVGDETLLRRVEVLRDNGTDRAAFRRGDVPRYGWRAVGSNFVPPETTAALLVAQLRAAELVQRARTSQWEAYRAALAGPASAAGARLQVAPDTATVPGHLFGLVLPPGADADAFVARCRARGVSVARHYQPLHRAGVVEAPRALPVAEALGDRLVRLPLYPDLTDAERDAVATTIAAELAACFLGRP